MMVEPKCFTRECRHFQGVSDAEEEQQVPICAAFPKGIPSEIAFGDNLHDKPFEGDHGIRYEKVVD